MGKREYYFKRHYNDNQDKIPFVWGNILKIHTINEFDIIEYQDKDNNCIMFHPYINGKDTNRACETLDIALLMAIGIKYEGRDSKFAFYANKMLNINLKG